MPIRLKEENNGKMRAIFVCGTLLKPDDDANIPEFEHSLFEHGKLRLLFDLAEFHGGEASALWKDIKFDVKQFADIERLAMVNENKWPRGMAAFCKPFTTATVPDVGRADAQDVRSWLVGDSAHRATQHE